MSHGMYMYVSTACSVLDEPICDHDPGNDLFQMNEPVYEHYCDTCSVPDDSVYERESGADMDALWDSGDVGVLRCGL